MASAKPLLTVVGATGVQGGSVISHFLDLVDQPYRLRGVTRNVHSDVAKQLAQKNVEMVSGDMNDAEGLVKAFEGASAIFFTTDAVGPMQDPTIQADAAASSKSLFVYTYEYERQQGINVFHAASKTKTLQRLVFSGLADVTKLSGGKYTHVYAFDAKAHAAEHAKDTHPELWKKTSILQVGFYLSNFRAHPLFIPEKVRVLLAAGLVLMRSQQPDGSLSFQAWGESQQPMIAAEEDIGPLTHALLQAEPGQSVVGVREWMTMQEFLNLMGQVLSVKTKTIAESKFLSQMPDNAKEVLAESIQFFDEFGYAGAKAGQSPRNPDEVSSLPVRSYLTYV